MREQCEHDRRGASEAVALEGNAYRLFLQGHQWSGARWVGSEYYERNPIHYWYEGVGIVVERTTEREKTFTFATWRDEGGRERSLRNFVLISDRWIIGGYQNELPLAEQRLPDLVDFVCAKIFRVAVTVPIPSFRFQHLSDEALVAAGIVPDPAGQIHPPNIVSA